MSLYAVSGISSAWQQSANMIMTLADVHYNAQ
jgi:hypothetical protein